MYSFLNWHFTNGQNDFMEIFVEKYSIWIDISCGWTEKMYILPALEVIFTTWIIEQNCLKVEIFVKKKKKKRNSLIADDIKWDIWAIVISIGWYIR